MKRIVDFLSRFNGFGLSDSRFTKINRSDMSPTFELAPCDYAMFDVDVPAEKAPVVGLLFGREIDCYCSDWNYVSALAKAGARVMFLDYEHHRAQLADCDALVLPDGEFDFPEKFYTDGKTNRLSYPSSRSEAYAECVFDALKYRIPVLGICTGAQMLAGAVGMKLYRSKDYFESPLEHKSHTANAHRVWINPSTPFALLMGNRESMIVNSRHSEFLAPERVQREELRLCDGDKLPLDIYATASDGIPEVWGDMPNGILCLQWHPENLSKEGMIPYKWIVDQATLNC